MPDTLEQILSRLGLERYTNVFLDAGVDLDILGDLEGPDFRELGINLGDQKRILREIRQSAPDGGVVERRFLSLLFIDVVGSTEMSVRMDPEDYRQTMFAYQQKCEEVLEISGGHLARKFGDGILAYFGFPRTHENDTRHAAQAALEILRQIPKLQGEGGRALELRVGIATGMALVDENPNADGRERGQVFGETPNLAARLQHLADPNSIVVCDATHAALSGFFELEDIGAHALKGLPEPVRAWRLGPAIETATGFGDASIGTRAPLINRVREIEIVREAWINALKGRGQVIVLRGCAGIGKSSLVGHLMDALDEQSPVTVYWRCDIDQRGRPLHPVAAQLERDIDQRALFLGGDKEKARRDWLGEFFEGLEDAQAGLASILASGQAPVEDVSSQDARAAVFELLLTYLDRLQKRHPVKLVIEDLHWIDPTTLEFLGELIAHISDKRILILGSERDNEAVSFPEFPNVIREELKPLAPEISAQILEREFAQINAPSHLKAQIIARCEGIPFYLEEVARAVLEENRRSDGARLMIPDRPLEMAGSDLPSSLMGPLLSRLESRAGARELASVAATIGRRFSVKMLRYLSDMPVGQIRAVLAQLVSAQILRRIDEKDGGSFEFAHSVMQEAAYQVLLKDRRIAAHRTIAETLQTEFAASLEAKPANIAYHYAGAEMWPEARHFWIEAAFEMQKFGAHREAVQYCKRGLVANAKGYSGAQERDNEIEIRELMGVSQEIDEWWSKAHKDNLETVQKLRAARGDTSEQLNVLNGLAGANLLAGKVSEARKLAERLTVETSKPSDLHQIFAHRMLGICDFYSGSFEASIGHFEQAIALAETVDKAALKQFYYADTKLVARVFILWAHILQGDQGYIGEHLEGVREDATGEPDAPSRMYALGVLSSCYQSLGDAQTCRSVAELAHGLALEEEQPYWGAWSSILSGWAEAKLTGTAQGVARIEEGLAAYASTGTRQIVPYGRVLLCDALVASGDKARAAGLAQELEDEADTHELRFTDAMVARLKDQLRHHKV